MTKFKGFTEDWFKANVSERPPDLSKLVFKSPTPASYDGKKTMLPLLDEVGLMPRLHSPELIEEMRKVMPYYNSDNLTAIPRVDIKPMSVNEAWQGKRFKTPQYKQYIIAVSLLLPPDLIVPDGLLKVYYEFGLSYSGGDWDNPVKPFQDILQKKYKFNDSRVMDARVKKVIVAKGHEYIRFKIEAL